MPSSCNRVQPATVCAARRAPSWAANWSKLSQTGNEFLRLKPNDAGTLEARGSAYLKLNRSDAAIADYDAALKLSPRFASALYGRGLAKQMQGNQSDGDADVAAARAIRPDVAERFAGYGAK